MTAAELEPVTLVDALSSLWWLGLLLVAAVAAAIANATGPKK